MRPEQRSRSRPQIPSERQPSARVHVTHGTPGPAKPAARVRTRAGDAGSVRGPSTPGSRRRLLPAAREQRDGASANECLHGPEPNVTFLKLTFIALESGDLDVCCYSFYLSAQLNFP